MFFIFFICTTVFVADVKCNCDHYINCLSDLLQDFFDYYNMTDGNFDSVENPTKYTEVDDTGEQVEKILTDVTELVKEVAGGVEKTSQVKEFDNARVYVKTFDIDNNENEDKRTTELNFIESSTINEDLLVTLTEYVTVQPITSSGVIPMKSDTENEIIEDAYYKDTPYDAYNDVYEKSDENSTDYPIIDYIELYKDTTNENIEYKGTEPPTVTEYSLSDEIRRRETDIENAIDNSLILMQDESLQNLIQNVSEHTVKTCNCSKMTLSDVVFPWIAAIFVKNDSKGYQYEYICDGALLSEKFVITSASCVFNGNASIDAEDFLVILGKNSLQRSGDDEKILKINAVQVHSNYTNASNDLAILELEDEVVFNDAIANACTITETARFEDGADAVTTAWSLSGDLTLIFFDKERSKACGLDNKVENTFCATYGNDVALCPSYGGVHVAKASDERWYLKGIRHGVPHRGICLFKDVMYTSLEGYMRWIEDIINKD
ncbi:hypothetical protein ACJJTC_007302 [Scirpophaga incertulas]